MTSGHRGSAGWRIYEGGGGANGADPAFGSGRYPQSVAVGDFNGDGIEDLAVASSSSNNVSILINNTPRVALPK